MAGQIKTIDYDSDNDIFYISNGEKVKTSLDIGDFVLDVSHDNLIGGIEIMDASENLGISKDILKNTKSIKMSVTYKTNHVYILLMIVFKEGDKEVNIPIPLTLDLGHKMPRKEVLVYN
ncbi:MAG: DUF2283 domain-containing protein [Nanoarchaeota archaeon]|nr:DUF2283 domain-containing protein [Nanoarchaeota archaeon]